jgi:hypothetical protein
MTHALIALFVCAWVPLAVILGNFLNSVTCKRFLTLSSSVLSLTHVKVVPSPAAKLADYFVSDSSSILWIGYALVTGFETSPFSSNVSFNRSHANPFSHCRVDDDQNDPLE